MIMGGGEGETKLHVRRPWLLEWGRCHMNSSSLRDRRLRDQVTGSAGSSAYLVYVHTAREHLIGGSGALASSYRQHSIYLASCIHVCHICELQRCLGVLEAWRLTPSSAQGVGHCIPALNCNYFGGEQHSPQFLRCRMKEPTRK